jgi:tetratricopeptide (TPR) repeat protein
VLGVLSVRQQHLTRSRARATPAADPETLAGEALALADVDPRRARELAQRARALARAGGDASAESRAERALGFAATEAGDLASARAHLRAAAAIAEAAGLPVRAAEARRTLARVLLEQGDARAALIEAGRAAPASRGADLGRLLIMRSVVLERLGRLPESLRCSARALTILRRAGEPAAEARALCNRGLAHVAAGDLAAAESDLRRAETLAGEVGEPGVVAKARHNLAIVASLRGDAPRALALLDQAEALFVERDMRLDGAIVPRDRCAVLLSVRLVPEACRDGRRAVELLAEVGAAATRAEALLLLAEGLLLDGRPEESESAAAEALGAFARQRRRGWALVARLVAARAAWEAGARSPAALAGLARLGADLDRAGFRASALDARLMAGRMALELDRPAVARGQLARAGRARREGGTEQRRARAWHAEALLRLDRGDRRGAAAALRAGLRAVERHRGLQGASELRAHAAGLGDELAALGLRMALAERSARRVLVWSERWRAGALWARPARPPDDAALAADLAELRRLTGLLDVAVLEGHATDDLARRRRIVEAAIVRRARAAAGSSDGDGRGRPSVSGVIGALGERALLELVRHRGRIHAVAVAGGRVSLHDLGELGAPRGELETLRFALRRLALARSSARSLAAARDAAEHAAGRLDALLLGPVARRLEGRPLVVVPTGELHALPWAALPSLAGREVTVAPSAALWLRGEWAGAPRGRRAVLVAGPGLPGAEEEVAELARGYPRARRLGGAAASARAVARAIDGAALAHVAAHGEFRADNPLFSSLRVADGGLTVYDLERLGRAPATLVLSACDAGLAGVRPGDELMGLAAALLALGTRALVASVGLAPDRATRPIMLALHDGLRAGARPSAALAAALADADDGPPEAYAARRAFVCLGAG